MGKQRLHKNEQQGLVAKPLSINQCVTINDFVTDRADMMIHFQIMLTDFGYRNGCGKCEGTKYIAMI